MKSVLVGLTLVIAASFYSVPSFAVDGGVAPPECANPDNKTQHPDWYRDGGYCALNRGEQPGFAESNK